MWANSSNSGSPARSLMNRFLSILPVKGQELLSRVITCGTSKRMAKYSLENKFTSFFSCLAVNEGFSRRYPRFAAASCADSSGLCSIEMTGVSPFGL